MKCTASGIILYRYFDNQPKILGLVALKKFQKQSNGLYDVPKGRLDPGETPIEAAFRECYEETKIRPMKLTSGPFVDGPLSFWIAECNEDPVLAINPETKKLEHLDFKWIDPDTMIENCLDYLKSSIEWAKQELL